MKPRNEKEHIAANTSTKTVTCIFDTGRPDTPIIEHTIEFKVGETIHFSGNTDREGKRIKFACSVTRGYQHVFFSESYSMQMEKMEVKSGKKTSFVEIAEGIGYKNGLISYPELSNLFFLAHIIGIGEFEEKIKYYKSKFSQTGGLFRLWEDEVVFL